MQACLQGSFTGSFAVIERCPRLTACALQERRRTERYDLLSYAANNALGVHGGETLADLVSGLKTD